MAVDIFRPYAEGTFPALVAVSPHGKDFVHLPAVPQFRFRETGPIDWYVERGYAHIPDKIERLGGRCLVV